MNKSMKTYCLLAVLFMFVLSNVFAQGVYEVRIKSNVNGAKIYIDGDYKGEAPLTVSVSRGSHRIRATSPGYKDAETTINITKNTTFSIDLEKAGRDDESQMFSVRIKSNVNGAKIYIDDRYMDEAPATIRVSKGRHSMRVTANGYEDYTTTINITRNTTLSADLKKAIRFYNLRIDANVKRARVYINGRQEEGYAPVNVKLEQGRYAIEVRKRGYSPYEVTVVLDRDTKIDARLKPSQPGVVIIVPDNILNRDLNKPEMRIDVFVDGKKQKDLDFDVERGRHVIRIETGALALEKELNFRDGVLYEIRLGFDMNVSEED
ncbi:MAG: PEGA domain-containing protein [Spirochaetales bacterium]|nr:PEGA domain-containing protein [Spirochaetales bacterium]